ncbi:MAG: DNA repair protein RecN [Clostridiales bacterium]|nr:DNA repair protein RecN [Clostridiales bacterium]
MLLELDIRNIALIDSLRIELTRGLNTLTGETGAGKSIVVDSVNLALGHRGGRELVRAGTDKARVRALFDISESEKAKAFLDEMEIEYDDGFAEVTREVTNQGKSLCRINGALVPLNTVREFTSLLIDLHGQQEHQRLLNVREHMEYLDAFGGKELLKLRTDTQEAYFAWSGLKAELERLSQDEKTLSQRQDTLEMQLKEIKAAKLKKGEEEELERQGRLFENSEKLSQNVRTAYERLYLGGKSISAQESMERALNALSDIAELDEKYAVLADRLEEALSQVRDIGYEVQSAFEELSFDPAQADRVYERLEKLKKLKRKYGPEIDDVIAYAQKAQEELDELANIDFKREELEARLEEAEKTLVSTAAKLTSARRTAASGLEKAIMEQLKDLGMEKAVLKVQLTPVPPCARGAEEVEFVISTNPGEPMKPLKDIASGGEMSRFMLALKVVLAAGDGIETLIFDEIDTGISGRMAQTVGEKLALLAGDRQVICVTHLAQIAALSDTQFMVEKYQEGERTVSVVRRLDDEGRLKEVTRLIGGESSDVSAVNHAKVLLERAVQTKKELRKC